MPILEYPIAIPAGTQAAAVLRVLLHVTAHEWGLLS